ncbi:MAG TPA: hypothetical protein PLL30_08235 [Candidatus Krumholzibacteria bacterium]|nr:hypothetical protein [Candidatus Krumholzibacteria bacterium]HPD71745.1 hypothetical protein [Candidatus Krumholzibacteria bacterium]HRY41322.1 hypothetical protein [Candidatus Krumholzibacteria bacterium]
MLRRLAVTVAIGGAALVVAAGVLWGRSPAAVEWRRARTICIESDDWGLCGFLPDTSALAGLDRKVLAPGQFPEVYWHSTLEDSAMVAELAAVFAAHRGRDGLPAVLQPNYILASFSLEPDPLDSTDRWIVRDMPATPPGYDRPGLWHAVRDAQQAGVWHPELHGRWHYDPELRRRRASEEPAVRAAAALQILPFPESERAWELGAWRDLAVIADELDRNLVVFRQLFGYSPRSVIAPDYVWNDRHEQLWCERDLRVIQGQRQQRQSRWRGLSGRLLKVWHRAWTRWYRQDRVYLDRNCLFEPVQQHAPRAITEAAVRDVDAAWRRREAAIVEAHRINFAHLDPAVHELGRAELAHLLGEFATRGPLFVVDSELADLQRRGTSWVVRGDRIVVRNLTRARRLVVVPPEAAAAGQEREPSAGAEPLVLVLEPGETRTLPADGSMSN